MIKRDESSPSPSSPALKQIWSHIQHVKDLTRTDMKQAKAE